jgi:hypothetical protein
VAPVFAVLALVTVPWTIYLSVTLPRHLVTQDYRGAWVGFNLGLIALLVLTAVLAYRGDRRVAAAATATATMLIVDAWFDVFTSPLGRAFGGALASALLIELPLAALCLWLALHSERVLASRVRQLARRAARASARATARGAAAGSPQSPAARGAQAGARVARAGERLTHAAVPLGEAAIAAGETAAEAGAITAEANADRVEAERRESST